MADTGCCGSDFKENITSMLGLMTLCLPAIILSIPLFVILSVLGIVSSGAKNLKTKVLIILNANLSLIHSAPLTPKARCTIAGRLLAFSPRFSGCIYKCFNISLLILLWCMILVSFYQISRFIGK